MSPKQIVIFLYFGFALAVFPNAAVYLTAHMPALLAVLCVSGAVLVWQYLGFKLIDLLQKTF